MLTYREARYVAARLQSKSHQQSLLDAGFSKHLAAHPDFVVTEEMTAEVERLQKELVANTLQAGLIDAVEIHEYLTEAIRADVSDIKNDDHSYKPLSEWPEIWRRLYEEGHIEVETLSDRSHDGATRDKPGGWDIVGQVTKVKLKFTSKVKLLELAMKHKAVNAMVEQKAGDVNVLVITAEKARQVVGAKKRLARVMGAPDVIEIEATASKDGE